MHDRVGTIAQKLGSASSSVYFWIDTLCVPSGDIPEKGMTIASMERVYKEATAVLVIDSELELIDVSKSLLT